MKYSAAATLALATGAVATTPSFTNSFFDLKEGQPFEITVAGCEAGCTVTLQKGPVPELLEDIRTISKNVVNSVSVTLTNLATGTYSFKVKSNADKKLVNYSAPFDYIASDGTPASKLHSDFDLTPTVTTPASTSLPTDDSSSVTETTNDSSASQTTDDASSTDASSTTSKDSSSTTTRPTSTPPSENGAAGKLSSVASLVGVAAAAAALLL